MIRPPLGERVALIGTGAIGGSFLCALRAAGAIGRAVGFDRDPERARTAQARGIVDALAPDPAAAVVGADLVVIAVPVRSVGPVLEAIAAEMARAPEALVTDVSSTKVEPVQAAAAWLPFPERFVGAHPIAGTERSGPEAAQATMFQGRPCVITPTEHTRPEAEARCRALWSAVGARVVSLDPARHDRVLALLSHLPHLAAFALSAAIGQAALGEAGGLEADVGGLWGPGFRDTTRIADSDPELWRDVLLSNRDQALLALRRLEAELGGLRRAIASGDGGALTEMVARAGRARRQVLGSAS